MIMLMWAELVEQAKREGFTRSIPSLESPTDGYMVALAGYERTFDVREFSQADLVRYVADHFDVLSSGLGEVYLGAWQSNGLVYLDVSECISDRELALDVAVQRRQLAVWDVVSGIEVTCGAGDRA